MLSDDLVGLATQALDRADTCNSESEQEYWWSWAEVLSSCVKQARALENQAVPQSARAVVPAGGDKVVCLDAWRRRPAAVTPGGTAA